MEQCVGRIIFGSAVVMCCPVVGALAGEPGTATPDQDRAYLAELVADAQDRTSLSAADAGHDGTFHIQSASGDYRLNIQGQIQFRYNANFRDSKNEKAASSGFDDFEHGFQTRRTKLFFSGNILNEKWTYLIVGDFGENDTAFSGGGAFTLREAIVHYAFDNGVGIGWGQVRVPNNREEMVDSRYQLAADRSVVNEVFNADLAQGVWLDYNSDAWRGWVAFDDGAATGNTDFTSAAEADYAFIARAEWKFAGDWERFNDFTSWRGSEYAGMLGGSIHFQQSPNTNRGTDTDFNLLQYTVDVSVEGDGWNFFAAFIGRHITSRSGGADGPDIDDFGVVVQGGIFVTDDLELFARYDGVFSDDSRAGNDDFNTVTVGGNYYFIPQSHAAKLTADVQVFLDEPMKTDIVTTSNTGVGLLSDVTDSQVALRLQFQLLF